MIEFLCPNSHRIRCTDDQAGRAAKCPKCGVKFIIPMDGNTEKTPADQVINQGQSANLADSNVALNTLENSATGGSSGAIFQPLQTSSSISKLSGLITPTPSMGRLFAKFWSEKSKDVLLEIILRNGEVYKPDLYSKKLSQHQQGVFAIKEMDGTYTIMIVSWDALSHVQIRKMRDLPVEFNEK